MTRILVLAVLVVAGVTVGWAAEPTGKFDVTARKRVTMTETRAKKNADGLMVTETVTVVTVTPLKVTLDPAKTAVVVCDMWDDHWCKSAAARCGELAKAADPVLKACRERGMTIVHAPSDCMDFYKDHPARKRMLAVKKTEPPKGK